MNENTFPPTIVKLQVQADGPADAVRAALDQFGFDAAVMERGLVELRIVADFTESGSLIHKLQLTKISDRRYPERVESAPSPSFAVFRYMGVMMGRSDKSYLLSATAKQIEAIDSALGKMEPDDIHRFTGAVVGIWKNEPQDPAEAYVPKSSPNRAGMVACVQAILDLLRNTP